MQVRLCAAFDCARPLTGDKSRWCERACYFRMWKHEGVDQTALPVKIHEVRNAHPSTGPGYDRFIAEGYHELVLCEGWSKAAVAREASVSATSVSNWLDAWALETETDSRGQAQRKRRAEVKARRNMMFPDVMSFRAKCFPDLLRPDFHAQWGRQIDATVGTGERLLLLASQRHGKAIDAETPILTRERGWVDAGDVQAGEHIPSPSEGWTRVAGVFDQGVTDAVEVAFSDGTTLVTNPEHRWSVRQRHSSAKWKVLTSAELGDDLWETTKNGHRNAKWRIPIADPTPGVEADLPVDPYVLGAWLGDGTSTRSEITSADPYIIDRVAEHYGEPTYEYKQSRAVTCGFTGGMLDALRRAEVLKNKHIPDAYLRASREQREELLRGLMDTDGTVDQKAKTVSFCTVEPALADGVRQLIASLGGVHRTYTKNPWFYNDDRERVYGREAQVITMRLPEGVVPFGLERKVALLPEVTRTRAPKRLLHGVSPVAPRRTVCFAVDADDHLFCAGRDYIVTHNTEFLMHYCMWRIIEDPNISILWVSKTMDLAEKMVGTIKRMFQYYEPVTSLLPEGQQFHTSQRTGAKWTDGEFTVATRTDMTKKSPTMVALGTGGTILGRDADLIIIDDPQDRARCMSPSHREKDKEWFFTDFMSRKEEHTGVAFIMSRQHEDDLPGAILADHAEDWELAVYPAHDPACTIPEGSADHGECVLWPEKRTYEWLMKQKRANPEHFARNYMMQPASDAMQFLSAEDLEDRKDHEHRAGERFSGRLVAGIDPASAKPTAAVLWGVRDGKRYLVDALEAAPGTKGIREVIKKWALVYGCRRFVLETNGYQGQALADRDVRDLVQRMGVTMIPQHTGVNKNDPRSGVVAMLHGIANPEGDYVLPGSGDLEVMMRLEQLYRQWLMFDPDALNARHAKDDLVMASWIAQAEVERVSRANKQKVVFLEDRTNYGGSSYGELTAYAGR